MAHKRMFSMDIVDSDDFLDMPQSSQNLYFHLAMRADDDGFVSPKKIIRMIGSSQDDFKILVGKRFLLEFENKVCVIKHWLIHNTIRKDRYVETRYTEQKKQVKIKQNKAYSEVGNQLATNWHPSIGKDRIGKDRKEKNIENKTNIIIVKNTSFDFKMAEKLSNHIQQNNPLYQQKEFKYNKDKWANDIRLMREQDKLTEEQIEFILNFSQKDEFWKTVILSTTKLRKHIPKLVTKIKGKIEQKQVNTF